MSYLKRPKVKSGVSFSHLRSKKQEKELAVKIGGRVTPASGAREMKGDVRLKRIVRIEAKTTHNKSFSVTLDMVRKIEEAALPYDEMPIIVIEFNDSRGNKLQELAVCPIYVLDAFAK